DALIHSTEKTLKDLGDKVSPSDRANIESALSDLKRVVSGDDKDVIDTKAAALAQAAASLAQQQYAAGGEAQAGGDGASKAAQDDVVGAEFEEGKDNKKKDS